MKRMVAGEQSALAEIYDRYSRLVYAISWQVLRDAHWAEDTSQEVFLHLWRDPRAYDSRRGSLGTWMTVVARHRAIDRLRKLQRESQKPDSVELIDRATRGEPPDVLASTKMRRIFHSLPTEQREILDLAYFGGLTHMEIVARKGISLGTVKSRIRSALHKLREALVEGISAE
jgi:RNA polymerase sigma-70 factor (ECF subfamily)